MFGTDGGKHNPNAAPISKTLQFSHSTFRTPTSATVFLRGLKAGGNFKKQGANLLGANFSGADLTNANLRGAILRHATFRNAVLDRVNLSNTNLYHVDFSNSSMRCVDFWGSAVTDSVLAGATLTEARLHGTALIRCDMRSSDLSGSVVYGCSTWDVNLEDATQRDLYITSDFGHQRWLGSSVPSALLAPAVTVDRLDIAQFLYLMLANSNIRNIIDTIGNKAVLILGRFTPERKRVLDGIREALRKHDFVPILFDFDKPAGKNFTETVSLMSHMSKFVIADITEPKSIPQELQRIVPMNPSVPVQPIIESSDRPYSMLRDLLDYPWFLEPYVYEDMDSLLSSLESKVIRPAIQKSSEIDARRKAANLT